MSTNRKLLSGDQYKKIAKLKSEKLNIALVDANYNIS